MSTESPRPLRRRSSSHLATTLAANRRWVVGQPCGSTHRRRRPNRTTFPIQIEAIRPSSAQPATYRRPGRCQLADVAAVGAHGVDIEVTVAVEWNRIRPSGPQPVAMLMVHPRSTVADQSHPRSRRRCPAEGRRSRHARRSRRPARVAAWLWPATHPDHRGHRGRGAIARASAGRTRSAVGS
jgi:hypothetical protein